MVYSLLGIIIIALCVKIYLMKKSAREISKEFADRLQTDTNTLIDISSRDKDMAKLASGINSRLSELRRKELKYENGDREIREAITNISHDIRTPLTAICGYLELLRDEEKSPEAGRYLSLIENRTDALKQLTEELFRYSLIMSDTKVSVPERVDLNAALEESIAGFYAALTGKNITPTVKMPEEHIFRTLDKESLSRIFGNILNNALKYSDGDLEIVLHDSGEIVFSNRASSLDEIAAGKLFNRFFTVESGQNSTGLGLSISKTLTEEMGGDLFAHYSGGILSIHVVFN